MTYSIGGCTCGSPLCKHCNPHYYCQPNVGKIDFERTHDVPPLPKEWRGLYESYKNEHKRYEKALRKIVKMCGEDGVSQDDMHDVALEALEGGVE